MNWFIQHQRGLCQVCPAVIYEMQCLASDLSGGSVRTPAPDEQKFPEGVELFLMPIRQCGILWRRMVEPRPPGTLVLAHLDTRKHLVYVFQLYLP